MSAGLGGRVVVLAGGLSHERDVSIRSGRRVADALRGVGVDVEERDVDATLLPALVADPPVAVFPVLHGAAGEDGAVRDVLDALRIPYVGATPESCRIAYDKPVAKSVVRGVGISTPESVALPHSVFRELGAPAVLDAIVGRLGLPLVVKPTRGGSALGATVVRTEAELPAAMVACFAYGDTALLEQCVSGTEIAVSVVDTGDGAVVLPIVEIVPDGGFYDYAARYNAGATEFFVPARLSDEALAAATEVALTAHDALGLRHLSRSDLIVTDDGTVSFLEVNVAPGMTETSLFPQSCAAAGLDLGELCLALVRTALDTD
jgi:D-alanine-D-alanine ligase